MVPMALIWWIYHFWARFWPYFNFVDFRAYFGPFSLVNRVQFSNADAGAWNSFLRLGIIFYGKLMHKDTKFCYSSFDISTFGFKAPPYSTQLHYTFQLAGRRNIREVCGKSKWKFKMAFAIRRPTPPPLNGKISRHFFTPLFFFCNWILHIWNGFYTSKISLLSPLIIGSKLTFISSSGRWLPTI